MVHAGRHRCVLAQFVGSLALLLQQGTTWLSGAFAKGLGDELELIVAGG
jgi:hypothetical protein